MRLNRRQFATALTATPLAAMPVSRALASLSLGDATLTTVSDGSLTLPGSFIFEPMPADELGAVLAPFGISSETLTPECNLALYRDGTRTVLFDVGAGPDFMPTAGTLLDSLDAAGVAPDEVTDVVFTHAHPDHIWGLVDDFDDLVFPDAAYHMGRAEWDYWWNPETVDTIGDARAAFAVGAKRRMERIEEQTALFSDGEEILPGIAAISSPGHTPGHMAFELRQGGNSALIAGDAIGNHHVAFARPDWLSGADQDAERAAATRRNLFDRIIADDLQLVGFHLPEGGIGRAEKAGDGYRFVPGAA